MRALPLGRTGYRVGALGFAGGGLVGRARGGDPRRGKRALLAALDAGVNAVIVPRDDEAEILAGEAIREQRARDWAVLAVDVPPADTAAAGPEARVRLDRALPAGYVMRAVEDALRRTRADALPLAQLTDWDDRWLGDTAWSELRSTMQRAIAQGKVLHWGIAASDPRSCARALSETLFETVRFSYNVWDRACEAELLEAAREREVGVIATSPLAGGALTDAVARAEIDADDAPTALGLPAAIVRRARSLADLVTGSRGEVAGVTELALRFCLSRPELTTVAASSSRPEHVREWIAVADGRALSPELLARLARLTDR